MATPIKKLEMMGVRQFRDSFPALTEPVRVIRSTSRNGRGPEVLGVWHPERRSTPKSAEKPTG